MARVRKNEEPTPTLAADPARLPRVFAPPHRCPACDSTEHTGYEGTQSHVLDYPGIAPDGQPYTRKVWRYTTCATPGCRQRRVDCSYEFDPVAWDAGTGSAAADLRAAEAEAAFARAAAREVDDGGTPREDEEDHDNAKE
jgi:hypothetical protein